jgi:hypothetical protein
VIVEGKEEITGMSVLVGGTEIQKLHVDIPPERTSLLGGKTTGGSDADDVEGWEMNLFEYNRLMEGKYAPSSILLSMHDDNAHEFVRIGVQFDQIDIQDNGSCKVRDATDETFLASCC